MQAERMRSECQELMCYCSCDVSRGTVRGHQDEATTSQEVKEKGKAMTTAAVGETHSGYRCPEAVII